MGIEGEAVESPGGAIGSRVADLVRRAAEATVVPIGQEPPAAAPSAAERDALIAEFRMSISELGDGPPGGPTLLPACLERLGALIGARWSADREEADRDEAIRLLRRAREGRLLGVGPHTEAARNLLVLLVGPFGERRPLGMDMVQSIIDASVPLANGGLGIIEAAPEIERLVHEIGAATPGGLPEGAAEFVAFQTDLQAALVSGDPLALHGLLRRVDVLDQRLLGPVAPLVGMLRNMLPPTTEGLSPETMRPPTKDEQQGLHTLLGMLTTAVEPGAVSADQIASLLGAAGAPGPLADSRIPGPMLAMARAMLGLGTGDVGQMETALGLLQSAATQDGADDDLVGIVRGVLPGLLAGVSQLGGSHAELGLAGQLAESILAPGDGQRPAPAPFGSLPGSEDMLWANRNLLLLGRMREAADARDVPALDELMGQVLDVLDELDELDELDGADGADGVSEAARTDGSARTARTDRADRADRAKASGTTDTRRVLPLFILCYGHMALARAADDIGPLRRAGHYFDQAYEAAETMPSARRLMDALAAPILALTSYLDPDPVRVAEAVARARASLDGNPVVAVQRICIRMGIATALSLQNGADGRAAVLDEVVDELERARAELDAGTAQVAAWLYWDLAEAYATRAGSAPGADLDRAIADARASLRASADDVLLQEGVQHGLDVARGGAARGLRAAAWAVRAGRPDEAVACLEAGRALVLGAAAVSASVPERLVELGEDELARQWREARPDGTVTAPRQDPQRLLETMLNGGPDTRLLPSGLRREVLALLRRQGDARDGRAPEAAVLRDAVARSGAEALVYLLPGESDDEGWALVVAPDRDPWALPLPALSGAGRAPVAAYVEATAGRFTARRGAERWEAALDALCDWAGGGVMGPVLDALGLWERGLGEAGLLAGAAAAALPVRLAVVACGNLGVVPWQAARLPVPDRWRAAGAPATVRACEPAVLTYAACGREFLRGVRARRLPLTQGQALVCVPADLDMAEDEVLAVHDAYYPGATLYGEYDTRVFAAPPPAGTPAEVLGLLGARASGARPAAVVHLVCHGTAGADPGSSALELGRPAGAEPGAGRLSVTRLLDTRPGPDGAGRPLVVLSACETDLSTHDHDEALTVTTAFVHALAADAVGSRWKVSDDASAVLMTVFHHHVAAGLAPPDALRAAQRWMLAPAGLRPAVPGLTPPLRRTAGRPELTGPAYWGAFIHQGNPAPRADGTPPPATGHPHREGEPAA
ncbi:CHAT domain-containing protein [Streptomyces sp. NPDC094032]|uniref:CHAT domain-containing protein n=1 Tax=Streptomyces sp. NPDC094032 TaxID=3155308 RepID=UPI0033200B76